ncbi:metalloregulator ArsR/SmtB family transcription factor [Nocardioides anomalus]|uniref:Metalloregulator ArsR/SmtB family transcription factor n=1 Tax=Nocardioides anomalus TaxID=2712223 RepID=A0A6G6WG96_9ACTN|nr:metalloregulator ArsR/SmtB family transcription factor [Nocardioides anomalus]QIG44348.1 metalloregulator ArsR/SmtB family transcription factor [Nocardioides anomalus]
MEALLAALADPARWRLVGLLAERPRPVGVLAQLAGARQPQTTKHLQTLERAGLVVGERLGTRRVYSLRPDPLHELAAALTALADAAGADPSFTAYADGVADERRAASEPGWADGRTFTFHRSLAAAPDVVWAHLTEPDLLARWWAPASLRISDLVFEAEPGGRIVLEYRDREDVDDSDVVVGRAEGVVTEVRSSERLAYTSSPAGPDGAAVFTADVTYDLTRTASGADLDVTYRITDSTVDAADPVAGIEPGFAQSLDTLAHLLDRSTP